LYFLEYWQNVTWYQEQPMTIEHGTADGQRHRYTPDYEIHEGPTKTIAECKPLARIESAQAQQQRRIGQAWANTNGYRFVTFTDADLRTGFQLDNLKLFWRYARLRNSQPKQLILGWMEHHSTGSVESLCQDLSILPQDAVPVLCHLLFHHKLGMDLNQAFSMSTAVWKAGK
jgi:hypothetical protein